MSWAGPVLGGMLFVGQPLTEDLEHGIAHAPQAPHAALGQLHSQHSQDAFVYDRYSKKIPHTFVEFGCRDGID